MEFDGDLLVPVAISVLVVLVLVVIFASFDSAVGDLKRRPVTKISATTDGLVESAKISVGRAVLVEEEREDRSEGKSEGEEESIGEIRGDGTNARVEEAEVLESDRIHVMEEDFEDSEHARGSELHLEERGDSKTFEPDFPIERGGAVEERELIGKQEEGLLIDEEDEWEGIERGDVEKRFTVATKYAGSADGGAALSKLGSDVQMRLYGLRKVATEGPCYEPKPMALKISARAEWQAWQRLGNMNPEVAMEQYISLLSESIPGWLGESVTGGKSKDEGHDFLMLGLSTAGGLSVTLPLFSELQSGSDRKPVDPMCTAESDATSGSAFFEHGVTKTFLYNFLSPTTMKFLNLLW